MSVFYKIVIGLGIVVKIYVNMCVYVCVCGFFVVLDLGVFEEFVVVILKVVM